MPITTFQAIATLTPNLMATGMLGIGTPKLARAIGAGLSLWSPQIKISTVDVGTAGAGKGTPIPITIAPPVMYANLIAGMVANNLVGIMAPAFTLGLANGLVALYLQAVTSTEHVGVGAGSGEATFSAPPAARYLRTGFESQNMTGEGAVKLCKAIGQGLDATFKTLVLVQPIVGPPSPASGTGFGTGSIF